MTGKADHKRLNLAGKGTSNKTGDNEARTYRRPGLSKLGLKNRFKSKAKH